MEEIMKNITHEYLMKVLNTTCAALSSVLILLSSSTQGVFHKFLSFDSTLCFLLSLKEIGEMSLHEKPLASYDWLKYRKIGLRFISLLIEAPANGKFQQATKRPTQDSRNSGA